jgi:hypothetical protein
MYDTTEIRPATEGVYHHAFFTIKMRRTDISKNVERRYPTGSKIRGNAKTAPSAIATRLLLRPVSGSPGLRFIPCSRMMTATPTRTKLRQKGKKPGPGARGDPMESLLECQAMKPPMAMKNMELPISDILIGRPVILDTGLQTSDVRLSSMPVKRMGKGFDQFHLMSNVFGLIV